ncbi:DUF4397 domain-containing protein [Actinomarinicola tropica]|uniref:DUF4397 domain-containing protein n=1 Tax=Actinomarinicola tropica TaxID=2789776 RepID=UPI00189A39EA|nr:DUF4397 domain-containing protein [Actinomarinicola tropica]
MRKILLGVLSLLTVAAFAAPAQAQSGATVMLLHGIPDTPVDVYVDGAEVIGDFQPADMQDLSSFAGQTLANIQVVPAGGDPATDAVIEVPSLDVPASGNWTVVAHLGADGTPTITPFENDTSQIAAGEGRITVRHTAAAPAVDIVVGDARPFTDLSNPNSVSADLPAGPLPASIAAAGGDVIASVADILGSEPAVTAGANTILYAVGDLEAGTFDLYVQQITGLGAAPTGVPTGDTPIESGTPLLLVGGLAALAIAATGGLLAARPALARRRG